MKDLRKDLAPFWRELRLPSGRDSGMIVFAAAKRGAGTSSVAASTAMLAARRAGRPVWLVDLNFERNTAYAGFEKGFAQGVPLPGRAFDASLRQPPIYKLIPQGSSDGQGRLLSAYQFEGTHLMVTRFRREHLARGQKVELADSPGWWQALRGVAEWIIVDAPPMDRSDVAARVAPLADGAVLVVGADKDRAQDVRRADIMLQKAGARVLGSVMNRVGADARVLDG